MFETLSVVWFEDCDTAVIMRRTLTNGGPAFSDAQVYNGPADYQPQHGATFTDPKGVVQIIDAVLLIDPASDGALPSVSITDGGPTYVAIVNGVRYDVIFASVWNMAPKHLELTLKRGPQQYKAR